jgi:hypothetical protein
MTCDFAELILSRFMAAHLEMSAIPI